MAHFLRVKQRMAVNINSDLVAHTDVRASIYDRHTGAADLNRKRFSTSRRNVIHWPLFDAVCHTQPHRRIQMTAMVTPAHHPGVLMRAR